MRAVWIVIMAWLLAGCSPDYDWREVSVADGAATALFPARAVTQERKLDFGGSEVLFTLTTASVKDAVFAVGYAPLPPSLQGDAQAQRQLVEGVVRSLYQNLGAPVPEPLPALGHPFVIEGTAGGKPARLKATVWTTRQGLLEGIVTAEQTAFPQAQADEFLRGLVPGK